jgi:integrase
MVGYQRIVEFTVMGRNKIAMPNYLLHRPTGQARVIMNGRTIYLGKYGSPESQAKYQQILAHVMAVGDLPVIPEESILIANLVAQYIAALRHDNKTESNEPDQQERGLRELVLLFGTLPAEDFTPSKLIALRAKWINKPLARATVNMYHSYVIRCFQWGVEQELVPADVWVTLKSVRRVTESKVMKPRKLVEPVAWESVEAIRPFVSSVVWDAVQVQWLTGMRASEVLTMTPGQIDRSDWSYRPSRHKTGYRGKKRVVFLGPQAQKIIADYLDRPDSSPLFSPKEAQAERLRTMRERRKSKVQPSQIDRSKDDPQKTPGDQYTAASYGKAIRKACKRAGIEPWGTHQLRHAAATRFRQSYGLDATQAALGHSHAKVTEIYADLDLSKARKIADEIG